MCYWRGRERKRSRLGSGRIYPGHEEDHHEEQEHSGFHWIWWFRERDRSSQQACWCIIVSTQIMFCILLAMSKVRSAVEPPAPQVMSQKEGLWATILSIFSNRLSTPSSVFGGKNSKEKTTLLLLLLSPPLPFASPPPPAASLILSITFIFCFSVCSLSISRRQMRGGRGV